MHCAIVSGATGFLGQWLIRELITEDIQVIALVRKNSQHIQNIPLHPLIQVVMLNSESPYDYSKIIPPADVFFHLAWEGARTDYIQQSMNISQSLFFITLAQQQGIKHFISTGSQAEYGPQDNPVSENSWLQPNTAYGICKYASYMVQNHFAASVRMAYTWTRIFSLYGSGDHESTLINYLFECFKFKRVPRLTSGDQLWDYLHAQDAARALIQLWKTKSCGVYNIASGKSRPLRDYITIVKEIAAPEATLDFGAILTNSSGCLQANVDRLFCATNWRPTISFSEGIHKTWRIYNG